MKTTIIFFLIILIIGAGGWIALVELAGWQTLWSGITSFSAACGIYYIYHRFIKNN